MAPFDYILVTLRTIGAIPDHFFLFYLSDFGHNFLQIPLFKTHLKIPLLFSRSGFFENSHFSKTHLKSHFHQIRSGIFKWVFKSGICRKLCLKTRPSLEKIWKCWTGCYVLIVYQISNNKKLWAHLYTEQKNDSYVYFSSPNLEYIYVSLKSDISCINNFVCSLKL